jgi:hypothetical protein
LVLKEATFEKKKKKLSFRWVLENEQKKSSFRCVHVVFKEGGCTHQRRAGGLDPQEPGLEQRGRGV